MTEKDFKRIADLYRQLDEDAEDELSINNYISMDTEVLCHCVANSIRDCEDEESGTRMKMTRVVDKLIYEHRDEIHQAIERILQGGLNIIRHHKESLQNEIKKVEVKF